MLKQLRDAIGHVHYEQGYTTPGEDPRKGLFSRLFAADLLGFVTAVQKTMRITRSSYGVWAEIVYAG
jgi:hypothetical protein